MKEGMSMRCLKCSHQNEGNSKFCSNCGEPLQQVIKKGVPVWFWAITLVCCLVLGGVGYGFYDYFNETKQKTVPTFTETASDATNVQQVSVETLDQKREEVTQETDRVALIKEVQQKVFTILTSNSFGSGFLYKKGGYVITNAHVVQGEVDVKVRHSNGQESAATVIGISDKYDIALLYVKDYANAEPLALEPKESSVGLEVIALGTPQGYENSASIGYITGIGRDLEHDNFIYKKIYQVDAQVDRGSSGGPLVDAKTGRVVGINSLLQTSETATNFAFSIPLYSMLEQFDAWAANPLSSAEILQIAGVYDTYMPATTATVDSDLALAGQYVQAFRMYYEYALNEGDFYWIADMLQVGSTAYNELEEYVNDIAGQGHTFVFLDNIVQDVTYDNGQYLVQMNEQFDFYSASGEHEYFDRYKTYTITLDDYGAFKISSIDIH